MIDGLTLVDSFSYTGRVSKQRVTSYVFENSMGYRFEVCLADWKLAIRPLESWMLEDPEVQESISAVPFDLSVSQC